MAWGLLRRSAPRNDSPFGVIASEAKQSPSAMTQRPQPFVFAEENDK
jgi:hypothetical protein